MNRKAFAAAFPATTPVMLGYLVLGTAFGLLMNDAGYNALWSLFMSVSVFAGSAQFLGVDFLMTLSSLGWVALMTFILNFRHMVYGLSMLEKFRGAGWRKPYMIFALSDETYALLSDPHPPQGVEPHDYYFAVALLDQSYWVIGSVLGGLLGAALPINTDGAEFAMTALFVVIVLDQWDSAKSHLPALLGFGASAVSLAAIISLAALVSLLAATFPSLLLLLPALKRDYFLIPALVIIVTGLALLRSRLENKEVEQ